MAERHWSKDFVEHLRTVHFALLAASVAVIVLASARNESEATKAHEQIKQIVDFAKSWEDPWLEQQVTRPESETDPQVLEKLARTTGGLSVKTPSETAIFQIHFQQPNWFVLLKGEQTEDVDSTRRRHDLSTSLEKPKTVAQFQDFWNRLRVGAEVVIPQSTPLSNCLIRRSDERPADYKVSQCSWITAGSVNLPSEEARAPEITRTGKREREIIHQISGDSDSEYAYYLSFHEKNRQRIVVRIPIAVYSVSFDIQGSIIRRHGSWGWHKGEFSESFEELASITKEYQSINLADAEKVLASEEKRSSASLDAFGIRFPAEQAIKWGAGAILIICIQLYFWVHLFEFKRKLSAADEGWNVAWFGVYGSRPARMILHGSIWIFPLAGVLSVGIRALVISDHNLYSITLIILSTLVSMLMSFLISMALPRSGDLSKSL